jgi:hypothetical protein
LQESYKIEGTCFSGTFHFIRFLKLKEFIMLGKEPLFGSFWIFGFSGLASGYHPLARALKSRKTLKGVPSTINCRYKKFDFLLSGTLHFVRFLKFKSSSSCCGRKPFLEIWIFRPCLRKITLQIQEDPQRGSLPLYIADTRDLISCQTQRGGWWIHGKNFYFRKINIKDKRRTGGSTARTFTSENEHKSLQIRQSHPTTNSYYQHHEHANRIPPKQKPKKFDL